MTEHRKQIKNRKRDLEAYHEHVHHYDQAAIAGGVFVINQSLTFQSPLRAGLTVHAKERTAMSRIVEHCFSELRNVSERRDDLSYGMDAKCLILLEMDNVNLAGARLIERPPAPQPGDPLNYDSFLRRICDLYDRRFGRRR
jgi:hypothetical protein